MKIIDAVTISELSRLLNKSRPTVYKYISDYEEGILDSIPESVKELFRLISEEDYEYEKIVEYCHKRFGEGGQKISTSAKNAIDYIIAHQDDIDFVELDYYLKKYIIDISTPLTK